MGQVKNPQNWLVYFSLSMLFPEGKRCLHGHPLEMHASSPPPLPVTANPLFYCTPSCIKRSSPTTGIHVLFVAARCHSLRNTVRIFIRVITQMHRQSFGGSRSRWSWSCLVNNSRISFTAPPSSVSRQRRLRVSDDKSGSRLLETPRAVLWRFVAPLRRLMADFAPFTLRLLKKNSD